jgi:glycosyltransferase involved in cell wall biosynthesis
MPDNGTSRLKLERPCIMASGKLPQVGVVITTHNCAAYAAEAIASVSDQTVRNLDIVVVDDASTDSTPTVIREVLANKRDSRISFKELKVNRGQTGAVRCGLAANRAPFVCILDGDDHWHPSFIERHLAAHLNTEFPVGFTYCDAHFINGSSELLTGTAWWFKRPPEHVPLRLIDRSVLPVIDPENGLAHFPHSSKLTLHEDWSPSWSCNSMASMMFRRDLLELVYPATDEQLPLYLDFYLSNFCMLVAGGIAIEEPLYAYRMHGMNSHSNGKAVGGTFETSSKNWKSISQRILRLILAELEVRRTPITGAIGEEHFNRALMHLKIGIPAVVRSFDRRPQGHVSQWLERLSRVWAPAQRSRRF